MNKRTKKILYVVNVDWFFLSHRLPLALAAQKRGHEVIIASSDTGQGKTIREHGLRFIPVNFSRKGTNLLFEFPTLIHLFFIYLKFKPDIVHHVTIKPVLFGSLATRFMKKIGVVNSITGLGYTFSEQTSSSALSKMVKWLYRFVLKKKNLVVIFQNPDDRSVFLDHGLIPEHQTVLIRGSGVDCELFSPGTEPTDEKIVLLASRMIRDKGIHEFYQAANLVKKNHPDVQFLLAGMVDDGNPNAMEQSTLKRWTDEGIVQWLGHREDMVDLLRKSSIVVLPTYYPEGVPKILIEAAACAKPIITTDRPGCREIVKNGINGFLVPEKDSDALAEKIEILLNDSDLRHEFGNNGRAIVIKSFSLKTVIDDTLLAYKEVLNLTNDNC